MAANDLVTPVLADFLSYDGLRLLFETIQGLEEDLSHLKTLKVSPEGEELQKQRLHKTKQERDNAAVAKALDGLPAAYIGMIGSRKKIATVREGLRRDGVSQRHLDRLFQPVGLPIGAETPEEIAVSVLSEIIAVASGADIGGLREPLRRGGSPAFPLFSGGAPDPEGV